MGELMKFHIVKEYNGYVVVTYCHNCEKHLDGNKESIWVNLDGPAGEYYCLDCMDDLKDKEER